MNLMAIINDANDESELGALKYSRTITAVPFGARYRVVDFHLSNMVNSGVKNVGVLLKNRFRTLISHIRMAKYWNLDTKQGGLFILPPDYGGIEQDRFIGDIPVLKQNIDYLNRSREKYVLICSPEYIYSYEFTDPFEYHKERENGITLIYTDSKLSEHKEKEIQLEIDPYGKVKEIKTGESNTKSNNYYIESFIINKNLLIDMINECMSKSERSLFQDGIVRNLNSHEVGAYLCDTKVLPIKTSKDYFRSSMAILEEDVRYEIFNKKRYIYTKKNDTAPIKISEESVIQKTLIGNGSIIKGKVRNSILFRDSYIDRDAEVYNSVIMKGCKIGKDVFMKNVILDKYVTIEDGVRIEGHKDYPITIEKNSILRSKKDENTI